MTQFDEENVQQWSLTLADSLTASIKSTIKFNDFEMREMAYNDFIQSNSVPKWIVLGTENELNVPILVMITYPSLIATTHYFFSDLSELTLDSTKNVLTFSEKFIAKHVSKAVIDSFNVHDLGVSFVRNEDRLHLVHPFLDTDSVSTYQFSWEVGSKNVGELILCHSNMF